MDLQSLNAMSLTNLQIWSLKIAAGQMRGVLSSKMKHSIRKYLTPSGELNHYGRAIVSGFQNGSGNAKKQRE